MQLNFFEQMDEGKDGWQGRHDSTDQIYKVI
jgi:hypothetical protein